MFHAKPATAGADAFDRLHMFMQTQPTAFDLRRLEADAQKLENADRAEAFTVRAAIAALRWDVVDARFWSEKACLSDASSTTRMNASVTFRYLNELDLATDYALEALRLAPLDVDAAQHAVGLLMVSGRLNEAMQNFIEHHRKAGSEATLDPAVHAVARLLEAAGIGEEQLRAEINAGMRVLSAAKIRHRCVQYEVSAEPDGGAVAAVKIQFVGDLETEIRLESELAHKLADMPSWNPAKLSVEFEYETEEDHAGFPA